MIRLYGFAGGAEDVDKSVLTLLEGIGTTVTIPIQFFMIEHPRGRLLFDTGMSPAAVAKPDEYPPTAKWGSRVTLEDLATSRLAEIGVRPSQIDLVANSHLHYDHCGGNASFPDASFLIQAEELRGAMWPEPWERGSYLRADFDLPVRWEELDGDRDVFGDGSVVLVSTPGHTRGSQSLLVRLEHSGPVILAQDAVFLNENIDAILVPAVAWDLRACLRSFRKLGELRRATGARLVPGHDMKAWDAFARAPGFYD